MALPLSKRIGFSAIVLLGCLFILEIIGQQLPTPVPPFGFPTHPRRGWTLPVSSAFTYQGVTVTTNRLGLRGPAPQEQPEIRLLSLGDSSVFGEGVEDQQTFSAVLSARAEVDVQNGGVPGYTCQQSLDHYRDLVDVLQPDILLVYSLHNDTRLIQANERWMGVFDHPLGLLRLASLGATWVRIQRQIPRLTAGEYQRCLERLLTEQTARGGRSLLISPVSDGDFVRNDHPFERPALGQHLQALWNAAEETDTPLLNMLNRKWTENRSYPELMLDEVHPSAQGHKLIARWIHAGLLSSGLMQGKLPDDIPKPGTRNSPF